MSQTGHTFSVRRMQTHDGPGLRTTVFMKGCPLHCAWCHNPEALSPAKEVWWLSDKCIGSRDCISACPNNALDLTAAGMQIDRELCAGCYQCVDACSARAMEALRRDLSPEELLREVIRDADFFAEGGGGVTVSGGEPLGQWRFVRDLLAECRAAGIHTALDTCGEAPGSAIDEVLPVTNLVLFDLKLADPLSHSRWTGADNGSILSNLGRIAREVQKRDDLALWIRTPLIPGATADAENIRALAGFISDEISDAVSRWELCTFNSLAAQKYRRLNRDWPFEDSSLLTRGEAANLHAIALRHSSLPALGVILKGRTKALDERGPVQN